MKFLPPYTYSQPHQMLTLLLCVAIFVEASSEDLSPQIYFHNDKDLGHFKTLRLPRGGKQLLGSFKNKG